MARTPSQRKVRALVAQELLKEPNRAHRIFSIAGSLRIGRSNVRQALHEFEEAGWLVSAPHGEYPEDESRRSYRLTPQGREGLSEVVRTTLSSVSRGTVTG